MTKADSQSSLPKAITIYVKLVGKVFVKHAHKPDVSRSRDGPRFTNWAQCAVTAHENLFIDVCFLYYYFIAMLYFMGVLNFVIH